VAPKWLGYPGHLSQVILNLIANAERYAYDGQAGIVDVLVSVSQLQDTPEFRIVVRDYGKGIPKENLALIFEAFFTTGRSKGGTGLGLSIVRNIVGSVFAGTITCESTLGEGTAFKLAFSHCKKQESPAESDDDRSADRAEIFESFVALQQKLVTEGTLSAEEQLQMTDLRTQVESFLAVQFQTEKRSHPRVPCSCGVTIADPGWQTSVRMLDLGEGGALLSFAQEIAVGQRLRIATIDQTEISLQVEVVSVAQLEAENESPRWKCGVRFDELGGAELRSIKLLLAQLMLQYWR